jgi:hypothetical protein
MVYKPGGTNFFTELKKRENQHKCPLCGKMVEKHIVEEGARFHVHWWDTKGTHCSEKDCEDNHGFGKCVPDPEKKLPRYDDWTEGDRCR